MDMDMPMDSSSSSNSSMDMMGMMVPWLHFTGGDNLFFKPWAPSSAGAIAGACIGLVVLSILERWLSGVRSVMSANWNKRALAVLKKDDDHCADTSSTSDEKSSDVTQEISSVKVKSNGKSPRPPRTLPPFIASHDVPRGVLFALQALLGYVLMLAVMTFQAAYIISVIAGLGVGEVLFGRLGHGGGSVVH